MLQKTVSKEEASQAVVEEQLTKLKIPFRASVELAAKCAESDKASEADRKEV